MSTGRVKLVRLGSRGSLLALAQAEIVRRRLLTVGIEVEVVTIRTAGDRSQPDVSMMRERGAFVSELEGALKSEAIDLAVHSAKDMPADPSKGLSIVAYPTRGDARDAVVTRDGRPLAGLSAGSRVGTESPRRRAFLLSERTDLEVVPIRGNVDTRLKKLDAGEVDALVLAAVGLERIGRADRTSECLSFERMLPAPGQGALAIQGRDGDTVAQTVTGLDDPGTRTAVTAERAFLRTMGGGCQAPLAAHARSRGSQLLVEGAGSEPDGDRIVREVVEGVPEEAAALGARLAEKLKALGVGQ